MIFDVKKFKNLRGENIMNTKGFRNAVASAAQKVGKELEKGLETIRDFNTMNRPPEDQERGLYSDETARQIAEAKLRQRQNPPEEENTKQITEGNLENKTYSK